MASSPRTHVALLRGINVGGKHRLPMDALVEIFNDAGCHEVRTYIQSGNVVFSAPRALVGRLPGVVGEAVRQRFDYGIPVVVRSAEEWLATVAANPYLDRGATPRQLHVVFLAEPPTEASLACLDPDRSPPDELSVVGREVFLYCPNGVARTKLTTAYLDRTLNTTVTVRNWATVIALRDMVR